MFCNCMLWSGQDIRSGKPASSVRLNNLAHPTSSLLPPSTIYFNSQHNTVTDYVKQLIAYLENSQQFFKLLLINHVLLVNKLVHCLSENFSSLFHLTHPFPPSLDKPFTCHQSRACGSLESGQKSRLPKS